MKILLSYRMPLLVFVLLIAGWEGLIWLRHYPAYLLPGPWEVAAITPQRWNDLCFSFSLTFEEAITGFVASASLGILIGSVFAASTLLRKSLLPYVIVAQTIPLLAVSPLIITWTGNGFLAVCLIAMIICLPGIIVNTTQGLISVNANLLDLFRMSNASSWTIITKLRLPNALPYIFTGLRLAAGGAVLGAVVGETFAGSASIGQGGLGYASIYAQNQTDTTYLFALIGFISLMGLLFFFAVYLVEWFFLHHWHESMISENRQG